MFREYYSGFTLLKPLSDKTGIQIDRLNFVICQLVALCLAFFMRKYLHPRTTSTTVRHLFSLIVGLSMSYFCFGNEVAHLLAVSISSYLVIKYESTETMQNFVFLMSMGYLATIHVKRLIYNYGTYNLDITGPLMVMVQKVSGLAFSIHDGLATDFDSLSSYRKKYIIKKKPSFLEYYSYLFQFQSVLAGPNVLFRDYLQFMDGSNFKNANTKNISKCDEDLEPSSFIVVLQKCTISVVCIVIYLILSPKFSIDKAKEFSFTYEWSVIDQITFLLVCTTLTRFMYYHAWILAEAVCNASGFGFSGYDEKGNAKWDLAKNVDIMGFEFSSNIRNAINSWNLGTNVWLRFLVYERLNKHKTLCTFLLSAVWHGFYPGYYVCFTTAALLVTAARSVRKFIRPSFMGNKAMKYLYDILTFIVTKIAIAYFTFPFIMYDFWPAVILYKRMLFFIHVGSIVGLFVIPSISRYLPKPRAIVEN